MIQYEKIIERLIYGDNMQEIRKEMVIGDLLGMNRGFAPILLASGMHCLGCPSSQMESLEEACMVHGIDVEELLEKLNS